MIDFKLFLMLEYLEHRAGNDYNHHQQRAMAEFCDEESSAPPPLPPLAVACLAPFPSSLPLL